jgi:hypothetical protein
MPLTSRQAAQKLEAGIFDISNPLDKLDSGFGSYSWHPRLVIHIVTLSFRFLLHWGDCHLADCQSTTQASKKYEGVCVYSPSFLTFAYDQS